MEAISAVFPYDIVTLIKYVEARPCLWDKSNENFRDKKTRLHTWNEVYRSLHHNYDDLSIRERKLVALRIRSKWVNIRDAFIRSLKKPLGQTPRRKYIYGKHLHFLLKFRKKDNSTESFSFDLKNEKEDELDVESINDPLLENNAQTQCITTYNGNTLQTDGFETSRNSSLIVHYSNDEKFFDSFIPYLKDMTENERIDLHMETLHSIKKIKQKRRDCYS